jgi:hypothetical protein
MEPSPSEANSHSRNPLPSMQPGGSLPYSEQPATCPYSEPDETGSRHSITCFKMHFNINFPYTLGFSIWSLSFKIPHKTLYASFLSH